MSFVERMKKGKLDDPLLLQVLPVIEEFEERDGFTIDPLAEQDNPQPGLLHKYKNRALLIVKGGCAINCRYCFRRHFPYQANKGGKSSWQQSVDYLLQHPEINEVILSGGDPLMAKDEELQWLLDALATVPHIKRLRIHSRLPVVIPARVTPELCDMLDSSRFQVIFVTHINHAQEIDEELQVAIKQLKKANVIMLNQSVLLKGVNDSAKALVDLSEALFDAGIQPYYLHVLDKVQGAAHFYISDHKAKQLMSELMSEVSGYLVPKLTREIGGKPSKTPLDLGLE